MKTYKIKIYFVLLPFLVLSGIEKNCEAQFIKSSADSNFYDIQSKFLNLNLPPDTIESGLYNQYKTFEDFWKGRLSPHGNFNIAARAYRNYAKQFTPPPSGNRSTAPWIPDGPFTASTGWYTNGIGRMQSIVFDPDDANIIYAGSSFGGVFQSTTGGTIWENFYTDEQLPITGVSDIVIGKDLTPNPDKKFIFIATGDGDAFNTFSIGVYRLEIGVNDWIPINNGLFSSYPDKKEISKLLINPIDNNIIYAATTDGIYRTTNALSASPSWDPVFQPTNSDNTYIKGLEFDPNDNTYQHIFASGIDIIDSYGGNYGSWHSLTGNISPYGIAFSGARTLNEDIQLINISAAGNYLYAYVISYSDATILDPNKYRKIYIFNYNSTTNSWGTNFYFYINPVNGYDASHDISVSRMPIKALSSNPNVVFWGSTTLYRSTNNGPNGYPLVNYGDDDGNMHPDLHKFVEKGNDIFVSSDGGLSKISNLLGTVVYNNLNGTGLAVGTIYKMSNAKHENENDITIIGEMDNGSHEKESTSWHCIGNRDGGEQSVKNNMDMVSTTSYNGDPIKYTSNNWTSSRPLGRPCTAWGGGWNAPIEYEPISDKYYFGKTDLYINTDINL